MRPMLLCHRKMIAATNRAAARFVARRNAAEVLNFVKEALDETALAIEREIAFVLTLAVSLGRDNRS